MMAGEPELKDEFKPSNFANPNEITSSNVYDSSNEIIKLPEGVDPEVIDNNKVFIAIPTRGQPCVEIITWMIKIKERLLDPDDPLNGQLFLSMGKPQNPNCNILAWNFLQKKEFTHFMIMNDDLLPDPNVIDRLLRRKVDVVCNGVAIYRETRNGAMICGMRGTHGHYVDIDFEKEPFAKVDWAGGACMLIKRHVLEKIPQPIWQFINSKKDGSVEIGSDENFCMKCKELGIDVWLDSSHNIPQHFDLVVASTYAQGKFITDVSEHQGQGKVIG